MFFENYKKRNSNIEILRIIAMFIVIFHHAISQGFSFYSMPESGINTYFYQSFNCLGWIEIFVDENGLITEKSRQKYD